MNMTTELMNEIIAALITIVGALFSAYGVPYIKSKLTAQQLANIIAWVEIGVNAAEKLYEDIEKSGTVKFTYVSDYLKSKGITLDESDLKNMINSAVQKLK